ncbi:MAG: SLC13 family permease [Zestosphaera sp.]
MGQLIALGVLIYLMLSLILRSRRPKTPVWALMALASSLVVVGGLVEVDELGSTIDLDVILFLIGMFSLVSLAESSGLLAAISLSLISRFRRRSHLLYAASLLFGVLSALAVNDTVALMGPPIAYVISRATSIDPKALFLLLAFSVTIGSAMTPIGNPQNVLIAVESGIEAPFLTFVKVLALPTLANLILTAYIIKRVYRVSDAPVELTALPQEAISSRRDALLAGAGLAAVIAALVMNDLLELSGLPHVTSRGLIPFVIAAGLYVFSTNPRGLLKSVDWGTVIFFITMFITMDGIWRSGVLQPLLLYMVPTRLEGVRNVVAITATSVILSQALSNVPFVKLFIHYMQSLGYDSSNTISWITLAMSSTIAGNLTLLGAASNIIILEALETRLHYTISFKEFTKVGSVVTLANLLVYSAYLTLLHLLPVA